MNKNTYKRNINKADLTLRYKSSGKNPQQAAQALDRAYDILFDKIFLNK